MKIINSAVRHQDVDRFISSRSKAKTIAKAKKITRKQERAHMKAIFNQELHLERLADVADKIEQARVEREMVFRYLMYKAMAKKQPVKRKQVAKQLVWLGNQTETVDLSRCVFRIERPLVTGEREFAVLASCAMN